MSINLRFPNITGGTEAEQLNQIKSYLHQLVQQLNWALPNLGTSTASEPAGMQTPTEALSEETFNELKALLIQSSSTLNSYYDKINIRLEDHYLKKDTFETYQKEVSRNFAGLNTKYVSQEGFEAYEEEVSQNFENLGETYVGKGDFAAYQESVSKDFEDQADKYVARADFDAYKLELSQSIAGLQEEISELRQMIEDMQNTGGE
jgi:hypothetical protein